MRVAAVAAMMGVPGANPSLTVAKNAGAVKYGGLTTSVTTSVRVLNANSPAVLITVTVNEYELWVTKLSFAPGCKKTMPVEG